MVASDRKFGFSEEDERAIRSVAERLRNCSSLLFITGAGISADSGLPTYRGVGGLYNRGETPEGLPIEVILSGSMMAREPETTWKYLLEIERACRGAKPNRGHCVIAEMEKHFPRVWTLTQNVDGFHRAAGSQNVIDIHGDMHDLFCPNCSWRERVGDGGQYPEFKLLPRCPWCNSVIRPDVVLFGEFLSLDKVRLLDQQLSEGFDAVFSIGTSSYFPYIVEPVLQAKDRGALTVEINPCETDVSSEVDVKIAAGAAAALDALWRVYHCSRS